MKGTKLILALILAAGLAATAQAGEKLSPMPWVLLPAPVQKTIGDNTCDGCSLGKIQRRTNNGAVTYMAELRKPGAASTTLELNAAGEIVPDLAAIAPAAGAAAVVTPDDYAYLMTLGVTKDNPKIREATPEKLQDLHELINETPPGKEREKSVRDAVGKL